MNPFLNAWIVAVLNDKHAISTIAPARNVTLWEDAE